MKFPQCLRYLILVFESATVYAILEYAINLSHIAIRTEKLPKSIVNIQISPLVIWLP